MLRLAIIGTNWITHKFVEAALASKHYELTAVFSRTLEQATSFAEPYLKKSNQQNIRLFTSINELVLDDQIDVVYIASPNSLHAEQAAECIKNGKHVIVEKPMASNSQEAFGLIELAKQHNVVLFEAFKTAYLPNFKLLKNNLKSIGKLRLANFTFCQYSSRYPLLLTGELPNTFNPKFSNGSLMDIGFYCVATAVELFGVPKSVNATAWMLPTGVDGSGTVTLEYDDLLVNIIHSKVSNSYLPSEIQGEDGAIIIDHLSNCTKLTRKNRDGSSAVVSIEQPENTMIYEAEYIANLIAKNEVNHAGLQRALDTMNVLTALRKQINLKFPADID